MKRNGKTLNTDPERAKKRAVSDARCALRKLGLLQLLAGYLEFEMTGDTAAEEICQALNVTGADR